MCCVCAGCICVCAVAMYMCMCHGHVCVCVVAIEAAGCVCAVAIVNTTIGPPQKLNLLYKCDSNFRLQLKRGLCSYLFNMFNQFYQRLYDF